MRGKDSRSCRPRCELCFGLPVLSHSRCSPTSIRLLNYDGQGYWLAQKRLSKGRFAWWPESNSAAKRLEAYEAQLLMVAGDVSRVRAAPMWRRVSELK